MYSKKQNGYCLLFYQHFPKTANKNKNILSIQKELCAYPTENVNLIMYIYFVKQ